MPRAFALLRFVARSAATSPTSEPSRLIPGMQSVFFIGNAKTSWLRYPLWYGLFDYNLLYTNALVGVTLCLARLAILFVAFLLFIARLDKTTMPGPRGNFINYDSGYRAHVLECRRAAARWQHRSCPRSLSLLPLPLHLAL